MIKELEMKKVRAEGAMNVMMNILQGETMINEMIEIERTIEGRMMTGIIILIVITGISNSEINAMAEN